MSEKAKVVEKLNAEDQMPTNSELSENDQPLLSQEGKFEHKKIYTKFFIVSGLVTLLPYYIVIAQSDVFISIYKDYDYGLYNIVPSYANIPFAFIILKYLSLLKMKERIFVCVILQTFFIFMVPLVAYGLGNGGLSFVMLILTNITAFIFNNLLQSNLISISSNFPKEYAGMFFSSFPVSNIGLLSIKLILNYLEVSNLLNVKIRKLIKRYA